MVTGSVFGRVIMSQLTESSGWDIRPSTRAPLPLAPPVACCGWTDMEVPDESICRSSWESRTCYPWPVTNQGLTDDLWRTGQEEEERRKRLTFTFPFVHHQSLNRSRLMVDEREDSMMDSMSSTINRVNEKSRTEESPSIPKNSSWKTLPYPVKDCKILNY